MSAATARRSLREIGCGQIDEIVRVGARGAEPDPASVRRNSTVSASSSRRPAHRELVLDEDLDHAAPGRHSPVDRVREAAGDRHVRAQIVGTSGAPGRLPPRGQPSVCTSARTFAGSGSWPRP